ncbi:short chain dehydrogenase/reductase [Dactylonectria macrodidyma]|uniref:Short chain dehydrogenase/reductase n=1 Tax=Dactylonectria macrodidyma TaxID=307937 RepID=A0A9P9DDT0_9HYPO|nr:short chain dehydrogenase/reductase [Dactylonectria macrodidyma]
MESVVCRCVAVLGAITLLKIVYKSFSVLMLYFSPPVGLSRYEHTSTGAAPWALVTGSSDGIGKAFSSELAYRGFNVVLHGRNAEKLFVVKSELGSLYPARQFRIIIADASDLSKVSFPDIAASLSDIPLKILINNAGAMMPRHHFGPVDSFTPEELSANISINASFPLLLTGALMPLLVANQPSLALNIGSLADVGMPLFPSYGPSKAFLMNSSIELGLESALEGRDVEVLGLRIFQVTGTSTTALPPSLLIPDAATWVKTALARVGCGRPTILPYWPHAVQLALLEALPDWAKRKALISAVREMRATDLQKKAL